MKSEITSIDPASITIAELHSILLTAVAPRPIAFASTVDTNGNVNLSPFSFFNVFSANPPILIFSPARRVKNNTIKHTFENVKNTKEVVINIVNFPIVEQMSLSSTEYDTGINEFIKSGLTPVPSVKVTPPRVGESPVSFECEVDNIIELGKEGGAGNLIISRVVCIHINNKYTDANGNLDTKKLDLVARMGGSWYARLIKESLFEIPKPIFNKGIGVDSLPKHALNSTILTGNNLGRLGNLPTIPSSKEIEKIKKTAIIATILAIQNKTEKENQLHSIVKKLLDEGQLEQALITLFCLE
ncbi:MULTISPECIES: flavin reductase family protein [Flavobacteriaceae]|uniref:Flavin reductase family protein n=2 Tax=Flavobacteriaceae TaxID=49546 RepID=A0A4Y8ASK1_9FLAO|nr:MULTISPECIES: flavin reductase family protein [Flavobacteriaceae]TEW73648.1 flavin reductase family protein [Gramella jeungdoensis]GGK36403.1 flavin reductase [Lutibacter litoralis]